MENRYKAGVDVAKGKDYAVIIDWMILDNGVSTAVNQRKL